MIMYSTQDISQVHNNLPQVTMDLGLFLLSGQPDALLTLSVLVPEMKKKHDILHAFQTISEENKKYHE